MTTAILDYRDQEIIITDLEAKYGQVVMDINNSHDGCTLKLDGIMEEVKNTLEKHYEKFYDENIQRLISLLNVILSSICQSTDKKVAA